MGQLAKQPAGEVFKISSTQRITYTYVCKLDPIKFPVAVFVPQDNPQFKREEFVTFQSQENKPHTIYSFAEGKDIKKSKLLIQVANKDAGALKKFFVTLSEDIQDIFKAEVLTASEIKDVRDLIAQVDDEAERSKFYLELQTADKGSLSVADAKQNRAICDM